MINNGYGNDEDMIDAASIEDRVFLLDEQNILPADIVEAMANSWDMEGTVTLGQVEEWLEGLPDLIGGLDCSTWGKVCAVVCPELYGEPRKPLKFSRAVPRSKAMMAALMRRFESKSGMWNPLDTQGVDRPPS